MYLLNKFLLVIMVIVLMFSTLGCSADDPFTDDIYFEDVYAESIHGATGRTATVVIASSDSSAISKAQADAVCDGIDDQEEIQAAIASSTDVALSKGTFDISAHIIPKTGLWIHGQGAGTILRLHDNTLDNVIEFVGSDISDVTISDLCIDGNLANNPANPDHTKMAGIFATSGNTYTRITITGCTFHDSRLVDVMFPAGDASHINISNNHFYGDSCASIELIFVHQGIVSFNTMSQTGIESKHDRIEIQNCVSTSVIGNTIRGCGIFIFSSRDCVFSGNTIEFPDGDNNWDGFRFSQHSDIYNEGNIIIGNTILGLSTDNGTGISIGFALEGGSRNNVFNNNIFRNLKTVIEVWYPNNSNNSFENNVCEVIGNDALTFVNTANWTIRDNRIKDSAGEAVYFANDCNGGRFEGNDISGSSSFDVKFESNVTGTPVVGRNKFTGSIWNSHLATWEPNYVIRSETLDLSGASTDILAVILRTDSILVRYDIVYTEASSGDAGAEIRVGEFGNTSRFHASISEASKSIGYTKTFNAADLTLAYGNNTITVGTAGGKTGTGEVQLVLWIAEY